MAGEVARGEPLPCPSCRGSLEPTKGRHGLVWLCRSCHAGAATLPILRQVAPRAFVNHLWQAALHDGRRSPLVCPSCARPFTKFARAGAAVGAQIEVCVRCFWVWLSPSALSSLSAGVTPPPALDHVRELPRRAAPPEPDTAAAEARHVLGSLAAGVLRRAR
jgi:ribosomal protein L37AE/L43A